MSPSVQTAPPTGISTVIGDGFFTPESPPDEIHLADLNIDDTLREVQFFVVELESHLYRAQSAANQLFQSSMNRKESQIRDLFRILVEETGAASSMQNHSATELNGNPLEKHQSNYISKVEKNTDEAFLNLFESVFSIIRCPNSGICWQIHGIAILSLATTYSEITMRRDPKYWVQAPFSMLWPKGRTGKLVPSVATLTLIYLQHLPTSDKRPLQLYEALLTQMETNLIPAQPVFDLFNELSMWIKVVVDNYWAAELVHAKTRCCEKGCLGGTPFDWNTHLNEQYFETITTLEKFTVSAAALRWVTNTKQNQSSVFDQIKVRVRGRLFRKDFSLVTWRTYVLHQKAYDEAEKEYQKLTTESGEAPETEVLALIDAYTNLCSVLQAVGIECSVLTKLGMIYWKLLDDESRARECLTQALDKIDDPQYERFRKCESVVEARRNLSLLTRAYEKKKKRELAEDLLREEQRLREESLKMEEKQRREDEIRKFREEEEERRQREQERQREEVQRQQEEENRRHEEEEKQREEERRHQEEDRQREEEEKQRLIEEEERRSEEERRRQEEQAADELRKRTQEEKRRKMEEAIRRFEKEMEDRKRKEKDEQRRQQEDIRCAAETDRRRRWEAEEHRRKTQEKLQKEQQKQEAEQRAKDYEERRRKREQNSTRRSSGAEKLFRQADQRRRDTSTNLNVFTTKAREIYGMASLMALLRWLYETFTPIDPIVAVRLHNLLRAECISANDFRSIIFIYHPDKNCRHGELWKYLCQEVTKVLTQIREEKKHLFD